MQQLEHISQDDTKGFNYDPVQSFPKAEKIGFGSKQTNSVSESESDPAPRASGLRRKRQCGVPSSYEEHKNKLQMVEMCQMLGKLGLSKRLGSVFFSCRIRTKIGRCAYYETFK